jgi:CheY-like chemotaxis protein
LKKSWRLNGLNNSRRQRELGEATMARILYIDDFTYGSRTAIDQLEAAGHQLLPAADARTALELAADGPIDAVILNCHGAADNRPFVTALRMLQPDIAVLMLSGFCGVPCEQFDLADACMQKSENAAAVISALNSVLCQKKYGLCRWVAA